VPESPTTRRMSDKHEAYLAEIFGGRKIKGSGSHWSDQGDVANNHDDPCAFRVDGKSTRGKSIAITDAMIGKIEEQAGAERPALAFRFYGNETLTQVKHDWVAYRAVDASELMTGAREAAILREQLKRAQEHERVSDEHIEALREERDELKRSLEQLRVLHPAVASQAATEQHGAAQEQPRQVPEYVPELPWTVVTRRGPDCAGLRYWRDGSMTPFAVVEARVERSPDSANRPRLIVNGARPEHSDRETG